MNLIKTENDFDGPAFMFKIKDPRGHWLTGFCGANTIQEVQEKLILANPGLGLIDINIVPLSSSWANTKNELKFFD